MAITTVTVTDLALNTESGDLNVGALGTLGTEIATGADGFNVDLSGYLDRKIVFVFTDQGGTGDDVTMVAGNRPPSQRADLGTTVITMDASDTRAVSLENAQFLGQGLGWSIGNHENNMAGTSAGDNTFVLVLALPRDL
tara:strand:- start:8133 stop:8549 length:417 start_codon:yes stop_codon:yes gene_type:complete